MRYSKKKYFIENDFQKLLRSKQIYLFSIFDDNQFNNQLEFTGDHIINCGIFIMKKTQLYI